jgi:imidazolonepropionase-like amidohydrolase
MRKSWFLALVFTSIGTVAHAQQQLMVEHGTYTIHSLLHAIGKEEYRVIEMPGGQLEMHATSELSDRGSKRALTMTYAWGHLFEPQKLEQDSIPANPDGGSSAEITAGHAIVREAAAGRTMVKPPVAFVGFASMPASLQMMMMRYWRAHGQPAHLPILRASVQALPLEIRFVGSEAFQVHHRMVRLSRYTVANLVFGREILWMNDSNRLAAVMTFAGGLPQETVLDEYQEHFAQLVHSGVRQEMLDLADLDKEVPPEATGTFAIVGARLIDGTGAPAIENATVLVSNGRIAAVGARVEVPRGVRVIHAEGKSLLPGLWEMHVHYSGVEFGPALLAAGVTTTRDCGGEFEFLTTLRDAIAKEHVLGPRMLLAGLIDSGGPLAFGNVDVETPVEAVQAVDNYADHGFQQIKVYTQIQPAILRVISDEAHKRGLTVTGHVPAAVTTAEGIADGMDMINHLQYVTRAMMLDGKVDVNSDAAKFTIALLTQKNIVVDPTEGWGEMAGHAKSIDPATFEPGINAAPFVLSAKYRNMGIPAADEAKFRARMETNKSVLHALIAAGVTIIPGSDTGLVGYGLDRELELYVDAGMTPMQAIQSATIVSARVMRLDKDSGSIEPGKRADLVLVDGNPLTNISDIRKTVSVVTDGRMYDCKRLGNSVGFTR